MKCTIHDLLLLANRNLFRSMGSGFRDKRENFDITDVITWFVLVVGVLLVIALLAHIVGRHDKRRLYNSPRALFRALCKAHELDHFSRRLLKQIARSQDLEQPARLFLEPDRFAPAMLSPALREQRMAIEALRQTLFTQGSTTPTETDRKPELTGKTNLRPAGSV